MSVPVIENIAANLKDTIAEITVANGFNQTLTAARSRRNDFNDVSPDDLTCLIVQFEEERLDSAIGTYEWNQHFLLTTMVIDSDASTDPIDSRRNQVKSDIIKKLRNDPTRGGYGFDTDILASGMFDDGEGFCGVAVEITVHYRVEEDDPYTQA